MQRQGFGIAGDKVRSAALRPGMAQHALGDIQRQPFALRITPGQDTGEVARAAAQVQPALHRQFGRHARQQLRANTALQLGHRVIAGRRTGKGSGDLTLVRQRIGCAVHSRRRTRTHLRHHRPRG